MIQFMSASYGLRKEEFEMSEYQRLGESRLGLWQKPYDEAAQINVRAQMYADSTTAQIGGAWLSTPEIKEVEDWGCGLCGLKHFLRPDIQYRGLDGSKNQYTTDVVDLVEYHSTVDGLFMRAVLEHNHDWKVILSNALMSFQEKMVLVLFTPWQKETKVIARYEKFSGTEVTMIDYGYAKEDIYDALAKEAVKWFEISGIMCSSQYDVEHMFFIEPASSDGL